MARTPRLAPGNRGVHVIELPRDSEYIPATSHLGAVVRGYYCDFLRSPYWRALRRRVIALLPECNRCQCRNHLQVHHLYYTCLGTKEEYYRYMGLELLCRTCHAEHHGQPAEWRDHSGPELLGDIMRRMGFRDCRDAA